MARNNSEYQFTPIPTQLFLCCDNNCRSTLFSLIQLSTYYESKLGTSFDGWFFRTNALLEEETNLSKNVLNGALDALYRAGIIDVIPQDKRRGKTQGARKYKVNFEVFTKYQSIPFEECSCSHPDFGVVTSDYKKGAPMLLHRPQLEAQPKCGKSDNNIDNIDNAENIENTDKTDIDNIDKCFNNNLLYSSCYFDSKLNAKVDKTEEEDSPHPSNHEQDCNDSSSSNSYPELPPNKPHQPSTTSTPSISEDFIDSQLPFAFSRVNRRGVTDEPDNYTDAANLILDAHDRELKNWIACIKLNNNLRDAGMARLIEVINAQEYKNQAECEKTALDLIDYAAKSEARYTQELRSMIYN